MPNRSDPRAGPPSRSPPPNSGPSPCRPRSGLFRSLDAFSATAAGLRAGRMHGHPGKWDSRDIHERFGYRYTDAELTEWAPRVRALPEDTALTSCCSTFATATTPTSSPYSSPDAHRGARRHRSKFFIGTHIYARSECSLTLSRTCRRSPQGLSHLPRRKSDRRLGACQASRPRVMRCVQKIGSGAAGKPSLFIEAR